MKIRRTSICTGEEREINLPISPEQWKAYCNGALVQNAFPHLTPGQREFIISGMTNDEWNLFFVPGECQGEEQDDDEPTL